LVLYAAENKLKLTSEMIGEYARGNQGEHCHFSLLLIFVSVYHQLF